MAKIFISYNRQSEPIVRSLANDIEMLGHTVWFDHELSGGQAWWEQILTTVRDCSIFVFVLSPEGLNSTACKREYGYAAELGKPVLPVLVSEGVSINLLPPALSKIEFVDYRKQDRDAAFRLARAINTLPPPSPLPDPLPKPPDAPISYLGSLTEQVESTTTLSYEDQSALLIDLKRTLREPENTEDARTLLKKLRKRRDLFATIAEDLDELLSSGQKPTVSKVSADPGPVNVDRRNVDEVRPSDYARSGSDGTPSILNEDPVPESRESVAHADEPTGKERVVGAFIGAFVGLVCAMYLAYVVGIPLPGTTMASLPLAGAIAGTISGLRRKRIAPAGVGAMVGFIGSTLSRSGLVAAILLAFGGAIAGAICGTNRKAIFAASVGMLGVVLFQRYGFYHGPEFFGVFDLAALLVPTLGAVLGNLIARKRG